MKIIKMINKKIFFLLFFLWLAISVFDVCFNSIKSFSEVRQWMFLTDQQKEHKIFGDLYTFCTFINAATPSNTRILLFSNNLTLFYYERYCIYPRIITNTGDGKNLQNLAKLTNTNYIVMYDDSFVLKDYKKTATFSTKLKSNFGAIYKRK